MTAVEVAGAPIPHWPGRMVSLSGGEQVWLAETTAATRGDDPPYPPVRARWNGEDIGRSGAAREDDSPYPPVRARWNGEDIGRSGTAREDDPGRADGLGRADVLCVHGMAGAATNWTDFMGEIAEEFACAAVDLPGSGFSPPPQNPSGYSIAALARTVAAVIEEQLTAPVHLVGNSMGGAVTVKLAATRPDLVRTLTLISPALPDLHLHGGLLQFPLLSIPRLGAAIMRRSGLMTPERRVAAVAKGCFYNPDLIHPARFAAEADELRRRDGLGYADESMIGAARAITAEYLRPRGRSLWHDAGRIRVPVLAFYGSHDALVHPRGAARAARTFPDARVMVLPRTGHVAQMEHPGLVARHFREMVGTA